MAPRISSDAIAAEMAKSLPGVPMSIANTLNRNAFGPFGYALGRTGDQTCLYGWQSVGTSDAATVSIFSGPRRTLSLRLRLCRSRANPAALVAVMQGLGPANGAGVLMASGYGSADALAAASGVGTMASAPVWGQPVVAEATVPGFEEPPPRPRRVSQPEPVANVAAPLPAPQAPAPAAPLAAPQAPLPAAPVPLPQGAQASTPLPQLPPALPASVQSPPAAPLPGMPSVPLPPP